MEVGRGLISVYLEKGKVLCEFCPAEHLLMINASYS